MRARSYHTSPGACHPSALCMRLWMISVKTLVNHSTAVDKRGCGKVDNRIDTQVAGRALGTGRARLSTG